MHHNEQDINKTLNSIDSKLGSYKLSFLKGILYGFGSALGAGVAIIVIGWILNIVGVIPMFRDEVEKWRTTFEQSQNDKTFVPLDTTK